MLWETTDDNTDAGSRCFGQANGDARKDWQGMESNKLVSSHNIFMIALFCGAQ